MKTKPLEKIKQIAEQMPESPEKQKALQAYFNLKTFEVVANINDFGRNSFVTHTTGLVERIEKMTNEELLKVLDMSEDEQLIWCAENAGFDMLYRTLADLAFRLRNEVDFNIYLEELEVIYHLWQKRGTIDEQVENNLITFTCWLAVYKTPIDMILAALKAKESK